MPLLIAAAILFAALPAHAQVTTAAELVAKSLGISGDVAIITANPTVGTTAAKVLKLAPARVEVVAINLSTNACYIAPTAAVSSTNGILLAAGGGSVTIEVNDDLTLPTQSWWAVCAAASSQLYTQELDLQ